ncbi:hypothetical protein GCM10025792_17390 [Pseudonocardia tropica]
MPVTTVLDRPGPGTAGADPAPGAPVLLVVPATGMRASFHTPLRRALTDTRRRRAGAAAQVGPKPNRMTTIGTSATWGTTRSATRRAAPRGAQPGDRRAEVRCRPGRRGPWPGRWPRRRRPAARPVRSAHPVTAPSAPAARPVSHPVARPGGTRSG